MKSLTAAVVFCIVSLLSNAQDAPKHAIFGREILDKGERLLLSFSVHAKVLVLKGNLDERLNSKIMPFPNYPSEALNMGLLGEAVVSFTVKEDGNVDDVHADKSTDKRFEQVSLAAVSQWIFTHPQYHGKPTQLVVQVTFIFSKFDEQG